MRKKNVRITDVAQMANVSVATISRVLNNSGSVSEDTKNAVWSAVEETGYKVSAKMQPKELAPTAALPAPREERLIGVILKRLPVNMFFETMGYALQKNAEKKNMQTLTISCEHMDIGTIKEQIRRLLEFHVCGIAIVGIEDNTLPNDTREFLLSCQVPIVFVERHADRQGFNHVYIDNYLGGYMAARHLIERGHRKILFVGRGSLDANIGSRRYNGFMAAVQEAAKPLEYLVKTCSSPSPEDAYQAIKEAFQEMPGITGIQLWYDGYAIGALRYLYENHMRVPDDVELIGHDDTYSRLLSPAISSVQLPFDEIAHATIRIIADWQKEDASRFVQTIKLEPKLILRGI
jgi:DNA-binding LacI/PurR family transcriptional regulator